MFSKHVVMTIFTLICSAICARTQHTGRLDVVLTDKETGEPITNAEVIVQVDTSRSLSWYASPKYVQTVACTGTNGVAHVEFDFCANMFSWTINTPSHYSGRSHPTGYERFGCVVDESDYMDIDTNTVEGLSKYNELKALYESNDYVAYLSKFEPKSVTYTNNFLVRFASFYPKHNPKPMYAYALDVSDVKLPMEGTVFVTNGVEVTRYKPVDFDMKKCLLLPTIEGFRPGWHDPAGEVSDFRLERFSLTTNGVVSFYGWIEFAPGCGAYKRKTTGDKSFPTTYEADTNETFVSRIPFEYHSVSGKVVSAERPLLGSEYMVIKSRVVTNETGSVTSCNYAKVLGPMSVRRSLSCRSLIFNPCPNDPSLEFDQTNNLATGKRMSNTYP